ncbi:MAG: extracellular solute-binding protein [Tyzzerella sp.]|nr:extracellular solute-binding protein [Tyzzerella sp.]
MMRKKLLAGILALVLACSGLIGCGSGSGDEQGSGEGSGGKTELVLWSTYQTASAVKLDEIIAKFNAENGTYTITQESGLNASGFRQKLATSTQEYYPSLFMGESSAIYEYAEAAYVKPLQEYLDNDSENWLDGMLESVKAAYTDTEGNMVGLPVGVSAKGWMVNVDVLTQAGYTLDDLTSFEKVAAAATAAHDKGLTEYGYVPSTGIEITEMLHYQGVDTYDNDNGHSGDVTKCLYTEGETNDALKKLAGIYAELFESGVAMKDLTGVAKGASPFISGRTLFWSCTSSYVYEFEDVTVDFEWAFIPYKGVDDTAAHQGVAMPEGTGVFIANTGDETEMQGAYEFMKFLAKPENQIFWSTYRGYTPYTQEALTSEEWTTWRDANFPSEAKLEEMFSVVNEDMKFPKASLTNKLEDVNNAILDGVMTNPDANIDEVISTATDDLNNSIKILQMRK